MASRPVIPTCQSGELRHCHTQVVTCIWHNSTLLAILWPLFPTSLWWKASMAEKPTLITFINKVLISIVNSLLLILLTTTFFIGVGCATSLLFYCNIIGIYQNPNDSIRSLESASITLLARPLSSFQSHLTFVAWKIIFERYLLYQLTFYTHPSTFFITPTDLTLTYI